MLTRALPFVVTVLLLVSGSSPAGITYNYYLEISPASVKLLDEREPDQKFSEGDLSNLRFLVRNIAAAHVLENMQAPREKLVQAALLFREGFLNGVLANFIRQQFEKGFWRLTPELNPLKYLLPVFTGLASVFVMQAKRWFAEAPEAEATLMKRLNVSKELVLENFEPFEHETHSITCLLIDGSQTEPRRLLYRLHRSGWFPGRVHVYHDYNFP